MDAFELIPASFDGWLNTSGMPQSRASGSKAKGLLMARFV
jgi:hypothetical protein